jgi:hypothetical protein
MKTNRLLIAVAALVLLLSACNNKDERMLTVVNPDGTCSREMSFHPDATSALTPLSEPIENDCMHFGTDWQRSWSVVGDSLRHPCPITEAQWDSLRQVFPKQNISDKILMHTTRNFQNVSEMSDSTTNVIGHLFKATASLQKHFKWFYTEYAFRETFAITNIEQIFPTPLSRFVSADSASYWFTGKPNLGESLTGAEQKEMLDEIEANVSHWFNACTFTYISAVIAHHYDKVKNPPVTREQFLAMTDSITTSHAVRNMDLYGNINQVKDILQDSFHSDAYSSLLSDSTIYWSKKLEQQYTQYQYLIMMAPTLDYVMPGKVIDAGDGKIENDVVHYKFSGERLIPHPYDVVIISRVTHVWAYIVTLLVIILAATSLLYRRK